MEWKEVRLGDVCSIQRGASPRPIQKFISKEGMPWVKISDATGISSRYISSTSEYIIKEGISKSRIVHPGDLIVSNSATPGLPKFMAIEACVHDGWLIIRDLDGIDKVFLYYVFINIRRRLSNQANGSVFMNLKTDIVKDFVIKLPTLDDQRRIASILSSLDRKIELNNKINADLEEMAQAIFKNWFVDFEPFKDGKFVDSELGMIPEGWKVISLSEIMKYNGGSQPPASEFIDTYQEGYIRFIQIRDYDNDSHITYIPISKRNKLCDELDIMIARYGAALGRICWGLKGAYNVALAKVTPIKSYYREYLRCYLNTSYFYQSINNKGARCAQSGFNQSDINSYMIAFPIDETVVMNFNDLCSSIMDKRLSLKYENSRLSLLRDTLLPRLMSGEIEVPE